MCYVWPLIIDRIDSDHGVIDVYTTHVMFNQRRKQERYIAAIKTNTNAHQSKILEIGIREDNQ